MPWRRLALLILAGVLAATAGTVIAVAVNVATGGTAGWFLPLERHPLWWIAGATAGVAGTGLLVWWAQRWFERGLEELVPARQWPERWMVNRPSEVNQIVTALRRRSGRAVGVTAAVHGAGGFGKTTVAKMVRADRRVLRRFGNRVYWVTIGRDVRKQVLVRLVNDLITQIQPGRPVTFTSAQQAADHLAAVLNAGPRRLLILDDVWFDEQLAAFPVAGRCARLVTTRNPSLAGGASVPIKVGQMSVAQARAVLLADLLQPLSPSVVDGLIQETGRWPLLLHLVNKILIKESRLHTQIQPVAKDLMDRIRRAGALQLDQLTGAAKQHLNVNDADQRRRAVRATIEAGTGLLPATERSKFAELGVFTENETIPILLVGALWLVSGNLDQRTTETLCARLADLGLVTLTRTDDGGAIELHSVIREFIRAELGDTRLKQLHQTLLDASAAELRTAVAAQVTTGPGGRVAAWWELPESARYLWDHLIEHLIASGRSQVVEIVATDLRWVGARLEQAGPVGPFSDLALIGTPPAERVRRLFGQAAHLLAPTEPPHSQVDILYSRVSHDPDWGNQAHTLSTDRRQPALINRWPLPDLPDPALQRAFTGHTRKVNAVAIAPDGSWLATGGDDGTARIWDPATGRQRAVLTGHTLAIYAVAIAPDGTWLATTSYDATARIWDAATGKRRAILIGDYYGVYAVAIAPDGTWLATSTANTVDIWDPATGQHRATLTGHSAVSAVAISPDGTWLASNGEPVDIWDPATGQQRATLTGHTRHVQAVAIAPDGTWLATGSDDGTARIWDPATGQQRATLSGYSQGVRAVVIAPDGTWLATIDYDTATVKIWDSATGRQRATLTGHTRKVNAVAIAPDGTWLASGSNDGTVRIWDPATGQQHTELTNQFFSKIAGFAPDGSWLATRDDDSTARIWDSANGQQRATLTGHSGHLAAVAIAPDGTWLATGSVDSTVRIWDPATGQQRATLTGHTRTVNAVAIAPDGTWLATGGDDNTARIWDPATSQQRAILTGHTDRLWVVAIAPDGTWLATGSNDDTARIWDPATGQQRAILTGHRYSILTVAIAPDGTWLATGSLDRTARIWDPATGQQRATLTGHTQKVNAVVIAPDGTWLATASPDGTARC